jgi:ADP-ribosylglycohydrolase
MSNVLIGGAIGDALGVPFETYLVNHPELINWDGKTYLGSKHHGLKPAQYSDDTQMSIMVAESLLNNDGFNPDDLSQRYINWIEDGIARGYGRTTFLAVQNLKSGKHWSESGIAGSYGNGTAMRAAPFGVYFRNDLKSLVEIIKIDSNITHASEEAEAGAIAIALTTAYAVNNDTENLLDKLNGSLPASKLRNTVYRCISKF